MLKVSILTASYNAAATLQQTIESVLSQDYPNIEYWVIDGGSTDETLDILKSFEGKIHYISEKDKGIYDAINKGLDRASGEIIGMIGADDFYPDNGVISAVVKKFEETTADALYGDKQYVDALQTDKIVRNWVAGPYQHSNWLYGWMPPHLSFYTSRKLLEKTGKYRTDFTCSGDYEWMLRALYNKDVKVAYLPKVLVHMRAGGTSNASWKHRLTANQEDRKAWEVNGFKPYFFTLFLKPVRKITQLFVK
jgi:glycosyltransferase involved in cell wall biosynthesis